MFGVCEAHLKSVALPCPSWQIVQPISPCLCGLVLADKQVQPRMRRERLRQTAANRQLDRLAPIGVYEQIVVDVGCRVNLCRR